MNLDEGIATITLDAPANRNALSARLVASLRHHLAEAGVDERVRAIVLTHTGPTFCSGMDLREAAEGGMAHGAEQLLALLRLVVEVPVPVVAHLRGNARAGGIGLLGAADVAIAPAQATFAFTEARLGLSPAVISLTTVPRMDPRSVSRYFLTGDVFDGVEAERMGLLTRAVDGVEGTDDAVAALLASFRLCSRQGLVESKKLTVRELVAGFDRDGGALARRSAELFASDDATEGMAAFREKRPPHWAAT
ncbi:enoyl-CoA hydratase family protein [Streptomyces sp. SID3343]|uniref:enoyl-CoA hydratase family protein n=1 Tax=Streptomyces sp. SID3343 TaxID=2690260 RepID=UPI00136EC2B3|nr:enoyl-CoA hydratase family protein [Streptomyces sp. SID3343]MYW05718.1 enoyl-CoA hydratase family protein [Streptomyces sp. SID3343]